MKTKDIYVIGSSNTDMVIQSTRLPLPGETVIGGHFFCNAGGKGANQAVSAARLGGTVHFIAKVGDDTFGHQAIEQFKQEGIRVENVYIAPDVPSGVALINVDQKGQNAITVAPGANHHLTSDEVIAALQECDENCLIVLQLEIPLETVLKSIEWAAQKRCKIVLNPAPVAPLPDSIYPHLFLLTPNELEASTLSGIEVNDPISAQKAGEIFFAKGCPNTVITLGSKGAYLYSENYQGLIPTTQVKAIDTTAAGDCFNGALAVALAEHNNLEKAVLFANKAASISVTRAGAQQSMPSRKEVLSIILS